VGIELEFIFSIAGNQTFYVAVCQTFTAFSKWMRKRETSWIIAVVVWLIALLLCIPVMLYSATVGEKPGDCKCT